jgi:hypothetical protein
MSRGKQQYLSYSYKKFASIRLVVTLEGTAGIVDMAAGTMAGLNLSQDAAGG